MTTGTAPFLAALDKLELQILRDTLQGTLYTPDDHGYDAARTPWSLHIVQQPALVVMAASADDVSAAVAFATAHALPVAVQATGHGAVVPCDGALLINTAPMQDVRIDPVTRTAHVAAGVKWGPVLEAAQDHGLAPLLGSSPDVGVVGYTLGGGMGWLARKYGLSCDSVRAIELVTADGQLHRITPTRDPELFWGVRGGAGNFGVVTNLEIALYPVTDVYGGNIFFPISMARDVMLTYAAWSATLPEEWTTAVVLMHMPPAPFIPAPLQGQSVVIVRGCFTGDAAAGEAALRPIRALGGIIVDAFGPMAFRNVATISSDPLDPMAFHGRTETLRMLTPEAVERLIDLAGRPPASPLIFAEVRQMGGAIGRPPAGGSAFGQRDMPYVLFMLAMAHDPAEEPAVTRYIAHAGVALEPHRTGQTYLNFLQHDDGGAVRVRAGYAPETYARLVTLKDRHDPTNMFRFNRNIPPSSE
jgi:FAD/FMN-containing dehydrogenase